VRAKKTSSDLTAACLRLLDLCGILSWRSNNVPVYDGKRGCYRTFHGLKGVPDILGILPVGGTFLGVEVKAGKDRLSADQKAFRERCEALGGYFVVVRDVDDLAAFLRELKLLQ